MRKRTTKIIMIMTRRRMRRRRVRRRRMRRRRVRRSGSMVRRKIMMMELDKKWEYGKEENNNDDE
jgi:hypothetical protein